MSYQDNSGHHGNHDKLGRPEPENTIQGSARAAPCSEHNTVHTT